LEFDSRQGQEIIFRRQPNVSEKQIDSIFMTKGKAKDYFNRSKRTAELSLAPASAVIPKRRTLFELRGVTTHKTVLIIVTAVGTCNPARNVSLLHGAHKGAGLRPSKFLPIHHLIIILSSDDIQSQY
jgi:hypothetical protein